jgi:hypothetical protein
MADFNCLEPLWSSLQALVCRDLVTAPSFSRILRYLELKELKISKKFYPFVSTNEEYKHFLKIFTQLLKSMKYDALGYRLKKIDLIYTYRLSSTQFQLSHKIRFSNVLDLSICWSWISYIIQWKRHLIKLKKQKNNARGHLFFDYLRNTFKPT